MTDDALVPLGPFTLQVTANAHGICRVIISKEPVQKPEKMNTFIIQYTRAVERYLAGDEAAFQDLPIVLQGTPFQERVWKALRTIPFGETRTYAQIARQIGSPKAVRAVGTAVGRNPLCIVLPCHRVVPSTGGIGNYAYGPRVKQWLLFHEQA